MQHLLKELKMPQELYTTPETDIITRSVVKYLQNPCRKPSFRAYGRSGFPESVHIYFPGAAACGCGSGYSCRDSRSLPLELSCIQCDSLAQSPLNFWETDAIATYPKYPIKFAQRASAEIFCRSDFISKEPKNCDQEQQFFLCRPRMIPLWTRRLWLPMVLTPDSPAKNSKCFHETQETW